MLGLQRLDRRGPRTLRGVSALRRLGRRRLLLGQLRGGCVGGLCRGRQLLLVLHTANVANESTLMKALNPQQVDHNCEVRRMGCPCTRTMSCTNVGSIAFLHRLCHKHAPWS